MLTYIENKLVTKTKKKDHISFSWDHLENVSSSLSY